MSTELTVTVPDIGDFEQVEIIELLVETGASVGMDDPLITLESDKAAMDIPAPAAGTIKKLLVSAGDKVSEGDEIAVMEVSDDVQTSDVATEAKVPVATPEAQRFTEDADLSAQVLVLGSGPGGYTAAFRAADLGLNVILVERDPNLGGVCLNVGCIPSKALLHAAKVIDDAEAMREHGVVFSSPEIHTDKLREWKDSVVGRLTGGLASMAKQRKVTVVRGYGEFVSANHVKVTADDNTSQVVAFEHCIVAAGSEPVVIPGFPVDPRVMDSTSALELDELPERMLVIGGGIIGCHSRGSGGNLADLR
ncbi:MAG: FAD-dependent oxidoreductase, partial [Pseudomonadota bacterium]